MDLLALAGLLAVCCFAPGFFVARRLGWRGDETIVASFGLSLLFLYATSFTIYACGLPAVANWAVVTLCLLALGLSARSLTPLARQPEARFMAVTLAVVLGWTGALLSLVRSFSGGGWSFDWVEHYHRALFFLERWRTDVVFIGGYVLPARPPMANLISAHFMAVVGKGFAGYQLALAVLNALAVAPVVLLARRFSPTGVRIGVLVAFLVFNPMFVQNVTYPWTKLLAAFFVLFALHLYLEGWRSGDRVRMAGASLALAAGIVSHYSAAPFAALLALHYVFFLRTTSRRPRLEAAAMVSIALAALLPWVVWSFLHYGVTVTLGSNTTVTSIERVGFSDNLWIVATNIWNTIVPHWFRDVDTTQFVRQASGLGFLRDSFFLAYQSSLTAGLGLIGVGLTATAIALESRGEADRSLRTFWTFFVVGGVTLGIAVYGFVDDFGVAQICLQPLILLALALLAARFPSWPSKLRWLACGGLLLDLLLGVVLHVALETNAPPVGLNATARQNWVLKERLGLEFFGDRTAVVAPIVAASLLLGASMIVRSMMIERTEDSQNG